MNILVICQYYKPEPFRVADICEELARRGHGVTVITGLPNYPAGELYPGYEHAAGRDEVINGVRVHRCGIHLRKQGAFHRFWNYCSFAWASCRYADRIAEDFDVVFVYQLSPVMMAEAGLRYGKRHGRRVVLYCLDLWPESLTAGGIRPNTLTYQLFRCISRRIYERADEILMSSRSFEAYFRKSLGIGKGKLSYLPQYAESHYGAIPAPQPHDGPYHFLYAGNMGEPQSVETILQAAGLLREDHRIRIHIAGDGTERARCEQLAEGLPNLTFYGWKGADDLHTLYTKADAVLVTTQASELCRRTLPGKVQTALAAGRCIVAAVEGETAEVVRSANCGICVPPEDSAALARAMRQLAEAPELLVRYGENARRYGSAHFCKEAFMDALLKSLQGS